MSRKLFLSICSVLLTNSFFAQTPIDVTDQTIKVSALSEEVIYFGFAEGDQIILNFTEVNGKEIKEVEVLEFPSSSKFSDFKTTKIENKTITVNSKAVYKFRFYNSSLGGRICKIKIQRIPSDEKLKSFNTSVKWVKEQDTTWNSYLKDILIGYDTLKIQKTRKVIDHQEKVEEIIFDKSQRVHSTTNSNGNKTSIFFTLPQNVINENETKKVVAWAYWVGVGEESNKAWQENRNTLKTAVQGFASLTMSPLGGLALGTLTSLVLPTIGENVIYGLVDETNKNLYFANLQYKGYDFGNGIAGYKKFTDHSIMQGKYFVLLSNDNYVQGIDVNVKVSVIIEHVKYKDEVYIEKVTNPKFEKRIIKEPIINIREIPIIFDDKR